MKMDMKNIKDIEINDIKKNGPTFIAGCIVEDVLYFSSWLDSGFYKMDINTGECTLLGIFAEEIEGRGLHCQAIYYEESIWFIPANLGQKIVKVNLKTLEMTYFSLPQHGRQILDHLGVKRWKFKCCYKQGMPEFWLVPLGYNLLLKMDMRTNQIIEIDLQKEGIVFKDGIVNFYDACFVGDDIWICPRDFDDLVVLNTKTQEFCFFKWKYKKENFGLIRTSNDWVVFLSRVGGKKILLVNKSTYEEKMFSIEVDWEEDAEIMHLVADVVDNYILLAPFLAHEYIVINIVNGEIQIDTALHNYSQKMGWGQGRYQASFKYGTKIIYTPDILNVPIMIYDFQENSINYIRTKIKHKEYEKFITNLYLNDKKNWYKWEKQISKDNYYNEYVLPVEIYLNMVNNLQKDICSIEQESNIIGKSIYLKTISL